jgi:hypothetical protein
MSIIYRYIISLLIGIGHRGFIVAAWTIYIYIEQCVGMFAPFTLYNYITVDVIDLLHCQRPS